MSTTGLQLYDAVADALTGTVIRRYSTSFGLASRLLDRRCREHVENVYALVRVADEVVDGTARQAGLDTVSCRKVLDAYEAQAEQAMASGYSTDLVVHAFARTARAHGIGTELTRPFFASMRTDLERSVFDQEHADRYVYGSAEVIGLMCLRIFEDGRQRTSAESAVLEAGARALGSAFQRVNFLRDWAEDVGELGRIYLPEARQGLDDAARLAVVRSVQEDLDVAARALPLLPAGARPAVRAAHELFSRLNRRLEQATAEQIHSGRIRVPSAEKAEILFRATSTEARLRARHLLTRADRGAQP